MARSKRELLSDKETAKILSISLKRLYKYCDKFDEFDNDEWDLVEGQHFEWINKTLRSRRFYEEGAMALAKYLQEEVASTPFIGLFDAVAEKFTHRRKKTRQLLVRRRVISEMKDLEGVVVRNNLVYLERRRVIRVLATNGKGLNAAFRREQDNDGLEGREPMRQGHHFDEIEGRQHWSQVGIVQIAKNMSENLSKKSRRAWTDAVAEVIEDAISDQKKYLDSFDLRVQKAMAKAKASAGSKCQVTLARRTAANPFDLHAHHLFDKSTRRDLADFTDNLLVIHEELHDGFHNWHGSSPCQPKDFIEYITTVESWRFDTKRRKENLHLLINTLESLQRDFENRQRLA